MERERESREGIRTDVGVKEKERELSGPWVKKNVKGFGHLSPALLPSGAPQE